MKFLFATFCVYFILGMPLLYAQNEQSRKQTKLLISFDKPIAKMEPAWAWFGYDEPNYTYMKDGKKLLTELAELSPTPVYIRAHNMLTTGNGEAALKWGSTNAYTEDANGNPVYDWTLVDRIFDTYIERGIKPMAEIGFMPKALSTKPEPYRHTWEPGRPYQEVYTGWRYPPNDYDKWAELVYQWVKHSIDRYGLKEVETWYWELWNEPDIAYWGGTREEFFKLYDYTAHAVKRASPTIRIGGPDVTGPLGRGSGYRLMEAFLKHVTTGTNYYTGKIGSPLDFIDFHAKGNPNFRKGHVQMNIGNQLRAISNGFELVQSFPELKNLPIILGESDPEGCAACGMYTNPENAYRNGTMFSSYLAAVFARKYALADHFKVNFIGAVTWAFEFENQPWFHGFRDLATNGVNKPVLNVFRMFGKMSGSRVAVNGNQEYTFLQIRDSGVRKGPDIDALATIDANKACIMTWNYHDDDLPAPDAPVELKLSGIPATKVQVKHYRIDQEHSNSYEVWKKMGSPANPSKEQIVALEKAGKLHMAEPAKKLSVKNGQLDISLLLPRQAVSFYEITWD